MDCTEEEPAPVETAAADDDDDEGEEKDESTVNGGASQSATQPPDAPAEPMTPDDEIYDVQISVSDTHCILCHVDADKLWRM